MALRTRLLLLFLLGQLSAELLDDLFISLAGIPRLGSIELGVIALIVVLALTVSLARGGFLLPVNLDDFLPRSNDLGLIPLAALIISLPVAHGQYVWSNRLLINTNHLSPEVK